MTSSWCYVTLLPCSHFSNLLALQNGIGERFGMMISTFFLAVGGYLLGFLLEWRLILIQLSPFPVQALVVVLVSKVINHWHAEFIFRKHENIFAIFSIEFKHWDSIKKFSALLLFPFVRGIHRSPVNPPHKGLGTRTFRWYQLKQAVERTI